MISRLRCPFCDKPIFGETELLRHVFQKHLEKVRGFSPSGLGMAGSGRAWEAYTRYLTSRSSHIAFATPLVAQAALAFDRGATVGSSLLCRAALEGAKVVLEKQGIEEVLWLHQLVAWCRIRGHANFGAHIEDKIGERLSREAAPLSPSTDPEEARWWVSPEEAWQDFNDTLDILMTLESAL